MINLESDVLKVSVNLFGAELRSVINKETKEEFMWSGDPKYWGRVSPVLFPIVGRVSNNEYHYNGERFEMSQHGFLRDQEFVLVSSTDTYAEFSFVSNDALLSVYPFKHEVRIAYELVDSKINIHWRVFNLDDQTMYYSIGAHPAFAMKDNEEYVFELEGSSDVSLITLDGGHINGTSEFTDRSVEIIVESFIDDALIFTGLDSVSLINKDSGARVRCAFPGFDYVGLWTSYVDGKLSPFVCIEPWLGITDEKGGYDELSQKRSIRALSVGTDESHVYSLEFL